jgi:hypothetical protein
MQDTSRVDDEPLDASLRGAEVLRAAVRGSGNRAYV